MFRIGIDIGGTFTDVVLIDEATGATTVSKLLTQTGRRGQTVVDGITRVLEEAGASAEAVHFISHGTTIATNAVLERKGARTALIANKGFRDILEMGRFNRPAEFIYRIQEDKPAPLVPRYLRLEVACRVDREGRVVREPDVQEIRALLPLLKEEGVEAVAVCFLFSFLAPAHEQMVRAELSEALGSVPILLSHEIQPEFREFPRTSTTVFAAYVAPVLRSYLEGLLNELGRTRLRCPLYVFQSNGGVARPEVVLKNPATTLLSGPAGAVMGATYFCRRAGLEDFITFDMGGTSLDVCLVRGAQPEVTTLREIDHFPVVTPMVDVHTIGSGGGSAVSVDEVGRVHVGPESMGAEPGPACYGRGGDRPTLTDVNLVLGYLDPEHFAGGQVTISVKRAEQVLGDQVAKPLGAGLAEASLGVYGVANHQMAEAIRYVSVERGFDPHDFTLVAFGGSGPIHAAAVARELGIPRVLVPRHPGLYSAHGIAMSDFSHDYMRSLLKPVDGISIEDIGGILENLQAQAIADLDTEDIPPERRRFVSGLDMRYVGQTTEINVPMPEGWRSSKRALEEMVQGFHERHEQLYTYAVPGEPVEVVNVRLKAIGQVDKPDLPAGKAGRGTPAATGIRPVWFVGRTAALDTPIFLREALRPGMTLSGPAIVQELSSTTVIPPDTRVEVDPYHNLILNLES